jgi:hypothetical protein
MAETQNQDNSTLEFLGGRVEFSRWELSRELAVKSWVVATVLITIATVIASIYSIRQDQMDLVYLSALALLLWVSLSGTVEIAWSLKTVESVARCLESVRYRCNKNSFQVSVESDRPRRFMYLFSPWSKQCVEFSDDDVRCLAISQHTPRIPFRKKPVPAIQLRVELNDGRHYRQDLPLSPWGPGATEADLKRFSELLERMARILGPERIESTEELDRAREALTKSRSCHEGSELGDWANTGNHP